MNFSASRKTKLSAISGCPYQAGVRRAGFHCISDDNTQGKMIVHKIEQMVDCKHSLSG